MQDLFAEGWSHFRRAYALVADACNNCANEKPVPMLHDRCEFSKEECAFGAMNHMAYAAGMHIVCFAGANGCCFGVSHSHPGTSVARDPSTLCRLHLFTWFSQAVPGVLSLLDAAGVNRRDP